MATTNFTAGTLIESTWLNDVDAHTYDQAADAHSADSISFLQSGSATPTTVQTAVRQALEGATQSDKNLKEWIDSMAPLNLLPSTCVLEKLRTDYGECAFYTPITTDGIEWVRWLVTSRFNTGLSGIPRVILASSAYLYASTTIASAAENQTTGTEGQAPTATQATSAATARVGTWTGPATVGGVTDIIYSTTIGDYVTYTVSGAERLAWRVYMNGTNGGTVKVVIKQAGVEIDSSLYLVPLNGTDRTIALNYNTGQYFIPLAEGLTSGLTYTVDITVHSSNPVGGRSYDGGLHAYAATAYNSTGRHGTWPTVTVLTSTQVAYFSGIRVVYAFTGTKVVWKYVASTASGIASFKVYDSVGAEIATYTNSTKDTYSASTVLSSVEVASGLTNGTYYLHVTASTSKNASSSAFRLYDLGATSYDEATAGTPGVDLFDVRGIASNLPTVNDIPDGIMFIGTGNLEMAFKVRRSTDAAGTEDFVGGTHGAESAPTLTYAKDGVTFDYAGAAAGTKWTAAHFTISASSSVGFPAATTTYWANITQSMRFGPSGYSVKVTRLNTAEAVIYDDYSLMLPCPNSTVTGTYANKGCAGPFLKWAANNGDTVTTGSNDNSSQSQGVYSRGVVTWNQSYAVYGFNRNISDARNVYASIDNAMSSPIVDLDVLQDRTDGVAKYYNRAFMYESGGRTEGIGDGYSHTNHYRVIKQPGIESVIG